MAIHVSYSSLNDFISCQQKTYFRIFEPGEGVQSKEMLMGSIAHKVLEKCWNKKDDAFKLAKQLCQKNYLDQTGTNSIEHFINTYFERFYIMVRDDDKIEKRFKIKLYDDVYLVGVFDRVSLGTIIDWKTNANPVKRLDNSVQFILYDLAYNLIYDKPSEGLYQAALSDGSLVRYSESKQHSETLIQRIIPQFVETVRNKSFIKTGLFNGACYRCPYKITCLGDKNELVHRDVIEEQSRNKN